MIKRTISEKCLELATKFPILTITGPRQSGKTTLAKSLFPQHEYLNLEDLDERTFAEEDPRGFLKRFSGGVIFDEIQRVPSLLSYLQGIVDNDPQKGKFILTGSHQFELIQSINQSLAGRTAMIKLLPFSLSELNSALDLDQQMINGFYPRIYQDQIEANDFYASYFETYVERDLRNMANISDLRLFTKFVRLLATQAGQLINYSNLSNDLGVSQPTIKKWLSLLDASYLVFLLPPYFANLNKRLIKTEKIYFVDTGLLCYLLGIENIQHLKSHPLRGNVFENLIVMDFLKKRLNSGKNSNLFFYRDRSGLEIDLVLESANSVDLLEIKSAETPYPKFADNMKKVVLDKEIKTKTVIYAGEKEQNLDGIIFQAWAKY
ncbi:MAG TPA: ATP-binding protein [Candidatus Gracilibacteria bacterium]|nr:ATP-binding protein [Candidatus Gracilibacteria bacterium]